MARTGKNKIPVQVARAMEAAEAHNPKTAGASTLKMRRKGHPASIRARTSQVRRAAEAAEAKEAAENPKSLRRWC